MACRCTKPKRSATDVRIAFVPEHHQVPGVVMFLIDDARSHHRTDSVAGGPQRRSGSTNHSVWTCAILFLHASHPANSRAGARGIEDPAWVCQPVAFR